jgi:WD40 repeat protein
VNFSPNEELLVTASDSFSKSEVRLWDTMTGTVRFSVEDNILVCHIFT